MTTQETQTINFHLETIEVDTIKGTRGIIATIGDDTGLFYYHRDLKPENGYVLFHLKSGQPIIDLGKMDAPTQQIARYWLEEVAKLVDWRQTYQQLAAQVACRYPRGIPDFRDAIHAAYDVACRRARAEEATR